MIFRSACLLTVTLALAACSDSAAPGPAAAGPLAQTFAASAARNEVPRDLMVAIAIVEDGLTMPAQRDVADDVELPAAGPLMLRHGRLDSLGRGAALTGRSELELRRDTDLALEASGRVLQELGQKTGANPGDVVSWKEAIEELGGYGDDAHRAEYASRVFAILAQGGTFEARDGERITLAQHDIAPTAIFDLKLRTHVLTNAEFPGAEWFPTSCAGKCDTTRGGAKIQYVVIHDTEGGWDASVATLQNDPGKSVQYIVGTDGRVGQFVPESYTAWHAGNYFYNQRSVGIEHVGYSTKPYTEKEYEASAQLVAYLTKKYGVPADRGHIIGHEAIPNGNNIPSDSAPCMASPKACESNLDYGGSNHHTDPGVWEWATYMPRFGGEAKCNDVYNLWNCSYDSSKAIRCANGKVEVATCNGPGACEAQPIGKDDICHMITVPKSDAGTPPPPDAGPTATPDSGAPRADGGVAVTADASVDGGCQTSPGSHGSGSAAFVALALGALLAARRRSLRG